MSPAFFPQVLFDRRDHEAEANAAAQAAARSVGYDSWSGGVGPPKSSFRYSIPHFFYMVYIFLPNVISSNKSVGG